MQQTTKYKFNLIDTSDTFSPDALNANAEKLETELARVETETAAQIAAGDSAVKSELQASINGQINSTNSALSAHAADTAAHAFVRLTRVEIPASNSRSITVANVTNYNYLMLNLNGGNGSSTLELRVNGTTLINFTSLTGSTFQGTYMIYPIDPYIGIRGSSHKWGYASNTSYQSAKVAWSGDLTLQFSGSNAAVTVTLYGLLA